MTGKCISLWLCKRLWKSLRKYDKLQMMPLLPDNWSKISRHREDIWALKAVGCYDNKTPGGTSINISPVRPSTDTKMMTDLEMSGTSRLTGLLCHWHLVVLYVALKQHCAKRCNIESIYTAWRMQKDMDTFPRGGIHRSPAESRLKWPVTRGFHVFFDVHMN